MGWKTVNEQRLVAWGSGVCFLLMTVFFYKVTVFWLGLLACGAVFYMGRQGSWKAFSFTSLQGPLFLCCLLALHTVLCAADPRLSWNMSGSAICVVLATVFLPKALALLWAQSSKAPFMTSASSPPVIQWLGGICAACLFLQFVTSGGLTVTLNHLQTMLHSPFPSLRVPYTFKPHLTLFALSFFVLLNGECQRPKASRRSKALLVWVFGLLALGLWMRAYTLCIGLVVSVAAWFLFLRFPLAVSRLCASLTVFSCVSFPWWTYAFNTLCAPDSRLGTLISLTTLRTRFTHWDSLLPFIFEHPLLGQGLGYSRFLSRQPQLSRPLTFPHNMIVELWLDMGFLGIGGLCVLLVLLFRRFEKDPNPLQGATGLAATLFILIISQTSYSNTHIWWLSALGLTGVGMYAFGGRFRSA